jgi:aminoglycoside phosphotransferase
MTIENAPDSALAHRLAAAATGHSPIQVKRFETGSQHYVFEASFEHRAPVVVRLAAEHSRSAMIGASRLSKMLRPLGVPLPEVIAEDLNPPFPHLILERLAGTDLGKVIASLPPHRLEGIAAEVVRAQRIAASTASGGRYGYAMEPEAAPHGQWSKVLDDNLARSRTRIITAGLFDLGPVRAVDAAVAVARAELDALPPIPFMHDTTTKNVIVTSAGTFSGIVDVDDLCFGDPRYVVALTLASLLASGGPTDYVDSWMKLAGFKNDRLFRLYVALFLVDFMSEHGQVFNGNQQASSPAERQLLLQVFAEQFQQATA